MKKLTVRISEEIHTRLEDAAKRNRRSINNYVTLLIDAATDTQANVMAVARDPRAIRQTLIEETSNER